jgi:hypothetical protein
MAVPAGSTFTAFSTFAGGLLALHYGWLTEGPMPLQSSYSALTGFHAKA